MTFQDDDEGCQRTCDCLNNGDSTHDFVEEENGDFYLILASIICFLSIMSWGILAGWVIFPMDKDLNELEKTWMEVKNFRQMVRRR